MVYNIKYNINCGSGVCHPIPQMKGETEMNDTMQRHLGNISRQVGHDVSNRYSYIVSSDDLTNAYLQMRDELGYPLMVDSRNRRAIVYNKKGLEKQIENMINECIISNIAMLEKMVVEDVVNNIAMQLNGLTQTASGRIVVGNNAKKSSVDMFAKALAKGLVMGIGKLIDEITNPKTDRNRK